MISEIVHLENCHRVWPFFHFHVCLNQFKISFFFQSRSKIFRKIHINNPCQWKYMNSFPNFNQISISIKDIAFLCFTNFHCNFVSNPTYITQSVVMLYYIWFIDLYFILFSSICIRHTLKLDFNISFWWYFEICTFNCIWFSRIVFFLSLGIWVASRSNLK